MHIEVLKNLPENATDKTPLLFVHGAWHAAWCWQDTFMPYFAEQGYPCYALDLRGHGKSEGHVRWASVHNYVADVVNVADDIEAEHGKRPIVIGHSMGGYIVQKYLEKYAAPLGVLLASIPTRGTISFFIRYIKKHPLLFLKTSLTFTPYHIMGRADLAKEWFLSDDYPAEALQTFFPKIQNESFRVVFDSALLSLPKPKKVKTPLLVLGAENDRIFPPKEVKETAAAYGVEAEIFPNMAHDMMIEKRWESVADRILRWLEEREI